MKKIFIIAICIFLIQSFSTYCQDIKICHSDVSYFFDLTSYELKDQLPDGSYMVYSDSAKTVLECSGQIAGQKRVNQWTWYFETGNKKRELLYQNGLPEGQDVFYYTGGQQSVVITYNQGIQNGATEGWYPNGIKMFEGAYLNSTPSGTWKFYNEDGSLLREEQH